MQSGERVASVACNQGLRGMVRMMSVEQSKIVSEALSKRGAMIQQIVIMLAEQQKTEEEAGLNWDETLEWLLENLQG